jgi:hypothetical protein
MAEYVLDPVPHDPWTVPHAHEPLIVPVYPRNYPPPKPLPAPVEEGTPALSPAAPPTAAPGGGPAAPGEAQDLGPLVDKWFPGPAETPGQRTPDELPPPPAGIEAPNFSLQPVGHDPFDTKLYLAAERAKQAIERQAQAPVQMGSPQSPDPFMEHEIGQPAWPYAQSPQDMDLQQALAAAGGGPDFPAMAPQAPTPVLPSWMDPQKQEASIGPQPADWQKGLEATLRSIAPQGSGLSDTASAIPSLIGMTPAGSVADVGQSWNRGDLAGVGMAALGALPGVGTAERVGAKALTAAERIAARREAAGLTRTLEANALPATAPSLAESLAPNAAPEIAGAGRLGIGGNQPPRQVPLLRQPNPFSPTLDTMHPDEAALTVNDILQPDYPAIKRVKGRGVDTIAGELDQRAQTALRNMGVRGGKISGPDPATVAIMARTAPGQPLGRLGNTDELLARNLASEAREAMRRGGTTAVDWYSSKFDNAMKIAALMHPEIATDPHSATAYRAALAITSRGETVPANVKLANEVYDRFKASSVNPAERRFDAADIEAKAKNGPAMKANLTKMNDLLEAMDPAGVTRLLSEEMSVRDWAKRGFKVEGELADTLVHGSAILGPKIGGGFYQNLSGNYNPTTFDLWWMRKFGRSTGNLVGLQDTTKQRARLERLLEAAKGDTTLPPEIQALAALPVPKTQPGLFRRADDIASAHERHYSKNQADYASKKYPDRPLQKSDLAKASIAYRDAITGINEAPTSGGQRNWMRAVTQRAREILAEHDIHMTNADLQATLWYPEKDLYAKLGGKPSEGLNVDYESAHRDLARSRGILK